MGSHSMSMGALLTTALLAIGGATSVSAAYPGSDGKIAFVRHRGTSAELPRIYTVNPDGRSLRALPILGEEPAWSPDGRHLAYMTPQNAHHEHTSIYIADANGRHPRRLVKLGRHPTWSPDGKRLAFSLRGAVYVVQADGRKRHRITPLPPGRNGPDNEPAWSPDGRRIAYAGGTGTYDLFTVSPNGQGRTQITTIAGNGGGPRSPSWSPDGREIAFADYSGIFTIRPDGSGLQEISSYLSLLPGGTTCGAGAMPEHPSWAPDGDEIVFSGGRQLCAVRPDGSGLRLVTGPSVGPPTGATESDPDWATSRPAEPVIPPR